MRTVITLPDEVHARAKQRAANLGISFAEFVRRLLDSELDVTQESLTDEVRNYLLAEEEECCPTSPESVVEHIQRHYDLEVDAASVQAALRLPRRIEFGARLQEELSSRSGR